MATQVGEAVIKLTFDGKDVKASLGNVESTIEKSGQQTGSKFGNAISVAAGSLLSKGISKAMSAVTSNIDKAIARVDTLNNFPKVMTNLGVSSEDASKSIAKMSDKLMGLPTTLDQGASAVQRFTSKNGDVEKSTDIFLALNNAILAGGQSTDIQATALEQLSQAYAKGKPDMMEWRSAMQAMPAQLNQVAMAMGYGEDGADALGEALRNGDVTMNDFMDTISKLNTQGVAGFKNFEDQARDATGGIQTAIAVMNSRITQGIAEVIDTIGQDRISDIAIGIGNAFKEVGKVLADVVNFVIDNWGTIEPILKVVGGIAGTILGINVALKAYHKIQGAINSVVGIFSKTIGGVSNGISKVTQVFEKSPIGGAAEKVGEIFKKLGETIKTAITSIGEILNSAVTAVMEPIKTLFKGLGEAIAGFFTALADPAIAIGAAMFAVAAASIAAAIFLVGNAVGAIMPVLTDLFNNIIMPIAQFIADTVLSLIDALTEAVVTLTQNALIPLGEFLVGSFVTIITTVADTITNLTNNALIPLIDTLSGAFTDVINSIGNLLTGVIKAALEGVADIVRAVGEGFEHMGNAIKAALEGVQGVLQVFADLIRSIAEAAVAIVALATGHSINYGAGYAHLFAKGGKVEGPGTSTSDSIPAMLSDGEYVIQASAAKAIGYDNLDRLNEADRNWSSSLFSDISGNFGGETASGRVINVYMTNEINNKLDADEIGQIMMESIRRAA